MYVKKMIAITDLITTNNEIGVRKWFMYRFEYLL